MFYRLLMLLPLCVVPAIREARGLVQQGWDARIAPFRSRSFRFFLFHFRLEENKRHQYVVVVNSTDYFPGAFLGSYVFSRRLDVINAF